MFGLPKRKTAFEGLVQISIANSHALLQDMDEPQDAAALSAYIAAYVHGLGKHYGITGVDELELSSMLMKGACAAFDYSPAFQGLWSQCYVDARASLADAHAMPASVGEDKRRFVAAAIFYERCKAELPIHMNEREFCAYSQAIQAAVDRTVSGYAPKWKHGVPADLVKQWKREDGEPKVR